MAKKEEMLWDCAPHTIVKHRILDRYLGAWFPILSRYNGRIIYIDGFAGPGKYKGGENGSPLIAMEAAMKQGRYLADSKVQFVFIEDDKDRAHHLIETVSQFETPENFIKKAMHGEFEGILKGILDDLDERQLPNAPIFAFIDPFGFSGVPHKLLERLLAREKTEVFIYFARNSVNRFINVDSVEHHMKSLFGLDEIPIPPSIDRLTYLKGLYDSRLRKIAKFVGSFTMIDPKGVPIYDLFFASNNALGYLKMKEAMWAVDETGGFNFSYKNNTSQMLLFEHSPIPAVAKLLLQVSGKSKNININRIEKHIIEKTIYLPKHMKKALQLLEIEGEINVHPIKADKKPRKGKYFAPDTIIDFL